MLLRDLDFTASGMGAAYVERADGKIVEVWKSAAMLGGKHGGSYNLFLEPAGASILPGLSTLTAELVTDQLARPSTTLASYYCLEPVAAQSILYELLKE